MSQTLHNAPLPTVSAPDDGQGEFAPLLEGPFAKVWEPGLPSGTSPALRQRLLARLAATQQAEAGMVTARRKRVTHEVLAPGVHAQTLYRSPPGRALRAGEPLRVRLLHLVPGTDLAAQHWNAEGFEHHHRELLVLSGSLQFPQALPGQTLALRDYHVLPAGLPMPAWHSPAGALVFVRESALPAAPADQAFSVFDAQAGWPDFAPGIQRRVLWQRQGQAAMLYYAQPGAMVPQHTHGHDEECLMVQGELYLDDVLLQAGDYQLAPAGSGHRITQTETGVVIYAHGDLDLQFVP